MWTTCKPYKEPGPWRDATVLEFQNQAGVPGSRVPGVRILDARILDPGREVATLTGLSVSFGELF